ncbi:MAG: barstar family protein [Candidatus Uhrbacteria bacterium]|nr:barstar family protein [Candidatus Uhrbacteria bacterium]
MKKVKIDTNNIHDWNSFHDEFQNKFGFPDFYGRNMDAWNDYMTHLDDPEDQLSQITIQKGDIVVLELHDVKTFKTRCPEQYNALIDCAAFVNWRRVEKNKEPILTFSFYT